MRMTSPFTRLMPTLRLIRSAGRSRIVRAVNGSSIALPENARFVSSHARRQGGDPPATSPVVDSARYPWLIELPWWSQRTGCRSDGGATGGIRAQCDDLDRVGERQPELVVGLGRGEARESDDRRRTVDHDPRGILEGEEVPRARGRRCLRDHDPTGGAARIDSPGAARSRRGPSAARETSSSMVVAAVRKASRTPALSAEVCRMNASGT